jgi:hypothetical protein
MDKRWPRYCTSNTEMLIGIDFFLHSNAVGRAIERISAFPLSYRTRHRDTGESRRPYVVLQYPVRQVHPETEGGLKRERDHEGRSLERDLSL